MRLSSFERKDKGKAEKGMASRILVDERKEKGALKGGFERETGLGRSDSCSPWSDRRSLKKFF